MNNVLVEKIDEISVISINRPHARNAVDGPTATLLADAFREFDADNTQKVAILTGTEGTFCAGADLKAVSTGNGNRVKLDGDGPMGPTRMLLGKPVIAAIEGFAVAGGLELAAWCDLRVAAQDAIFGVYCRRWGVPLVDGGTVRLTRLLGHSHAMDLILTGRGICGDEAKQMGIANRLTNKGEALSGAIALARELCAFPQKCMRSDRLSSYEQWNLSIPEALQYETELGREVIKSGETAEGAKRFAGGRGRHGNFNEI